MHLKSKDIVNQPAEIVYPLVRDQLPELVPYLQNVERIETISKEEKANQQTEILNHWFAKADIPFLAKKFIKPEFMSWKDHAVWFDSERKVEYTLESFLGNDLFEVRGVNYFQPMEGDPSKTVIQVTCDVSIYPEKIPGVPTFLAKKVQPMIEELVKKMLQPNLTSLGQGLIRYYESKRTES